MADLVKQVLASLARILDKLHQLIEHKTGVIFGFALSSSPADYRLYFRIGGGKKKTLVNFEAGLGGKRYFYLSHEPSVRRG